MEATKEKPTFTPGPWHAYWSYKDKHRDIACKDGNSIAKEVHHANARLIAAAPELLEQCKLFEKCLTHLINSGDSGADLDRDKLREILAKVEEGEG